MDVDALSLSATDVPDTQTTVSSRDNDEQPRESVEEPEEFAQYKWRQEFEDDLRDMATKGTMSPEWPILANIIKSRLVHNTHAFLVKTPRPKYRPLPPATHRAPLLPATSVDSFAIDDVPLETLRPSPAPSQETPTDVPSTPGGLVIPPFPPRTSSRGQGQQRLGPHQRAGEGIVMDDEAVIGGRTLKSEMQPAEAWAFLKSLIKLLDEFPTAPPFTIQRLCELAWKPFQQHTSIGKYLRAIEKNLLVTTTYDADAADAENGNPSGGFPGMSNGTVRSRTSSVSSTSSSSSQNAPLFSPIPFLVEQRLVNPDGTPISAPATLPGRSSGTSEVDAHVSALSIDLNAAKEDGDVTMREPQGGRPGTPMHDQFHTDAKESAPPSHLALAPSGVAALAQNGTNGSTTAPTDTAHEPFTGRVDELDAGPLLHQATPASSSDPHQLHLPPPDEDTTTRHQEGTGERGTMTPHAMSDRPQAISSTTDLSASGSASSFSQKPMDPPQPGGARTIRAMPRTSSVAGSLNERFVTGEILEPNVLASGSETDVRVGGHEDVGESPAKAAKTS